MIANAADRDACARKIRHTTATKAIKSASKSGASYNAKGLHVYKCPSCDGWHLTHKLRHPHSGDNA